MLLCHLAVALYAGSAHDITRRRRLIPEGQEGGVPASGSGGSSDKVWTCVCWYHPWNPGAGFKTSVCRLLAV